MTKEQTALDIARRMAELGERSHAVTAYTLALADARDRQPETELEAALYLFENGGNYKVAYDAFRSLYRRGFQRETLLELMTQAFYQPNIKLLKSRYEKNCRLLRKYPYWRRMCTPSMSWSTSGTTCGKASGWAGRTTSISITRTGGSSAPISRS